MNQKEYELIAGVYHRAFIQLSTVKQADQWRDMVFEMARMLEDNYPKTFDRAKFLKACGIETN